MPSTLESIVSAYVRLKNRPALEDMRELRRTLKGHLLEARSNIDPRRSLEQVNDDLRVIEKGLERLLIA